MSSGPWLVVTPARNEAERLPKLAASLAAQTVQPVALWVIVDDGSDDGTADCVDPASLPFDVAVISRTNTGGLTGASERVAFEDGITLGLERVPNAQRILKIDADLVLAPDHFAHLATAQGDVVGGVITDERVQSMPHHVRGGLRSYSRAAWDVARAVPVALGWDVLDEVAIRAAGMDVRVVPEAKATGTRRTGSSEGLLRGRVRAGIVARYTGYHPVYLALRVVRIATQRPPIVGAGAVLWGYAKAGRGPFTKELKRAQRREQSQRLAEMIRQPLTWVRTNLRNAHD